MTKRASEDQCLGSFDDTIFAAKLFGVRIIPEYGLDYSVPSVGSFSASLNAANMEAHER